MTTTPPDEGRPYDRISQYDPTLLNEISEIVTDESRHYATLDDRYSIAVRVIELFTDLSAVLEHWAKPQPPADLVCHTTPFALADWILNTAETAFPWPGELDEVIAEDIATAVEKSDWLAQQLAEAEKRGALRVLRELKNDQIAQKALIRAWIQSKVARIEREGE